MLDPYCLAYQNTDLIPQLETKVSSNQLLNFQIILCVKIKITWKLNSLYKLLGQHFFAVESIETN